MNGLELYNAMLEELDEQGVEAQQFRDLNLPDRVAWEGLAKRVEWKERQ